MSGSYQEAAFNHFRLDRDEGQETKLIVWCEAAGMGPQLERVADGYGVLVFSSGGFDSLTEKHRFAEQAARSERPVEVLSVGDLDVSGAHMPLALSEDVQAFVDELGGSATFTRLAVTPQQVKALRLPTAPPKASDKRAFHGKTCQAEAIPPEELARIVRDGIEARMDTDVYRRLLKREERERAKLRRLIGE